MIDRSPENPFRIMLVEDDFLIAAELESHLNKLGYEVCGHVTSARDVMPAARNLAPDLILIDITLNERLDGIEAALQIRSGLQIPVVFVTAHADEEVLRQAKSAMPYGYLLKPFHRADLRVSVEMAFNLALAEKKQKAAEHLLRLQRDLGLALGAVEDLDAAYKLCCSFALRMPGIDCVGAYLIDKETGGLTLSSSAGLSNTFIEPMRDIGPDNKRARLVMAGRTVFLDYETVAINYPEIFKDGLKSLAVFPIKNDDRVAACFIFGSRTLQFMPAETRDALETFVLQLSESTSRFFAERALREREELFRELAEYSHAAFSLFDLKKKKRIYVSPAFERIWGRPSDELYQSAAAPLKYIHPDDRERVAAAFLRRNSGYGGELEYRIIRPDGEVRWVRNRSHPVRNSSGEVYRMSNVAEDVTERKLTEIELAEHKGRLEEMVMRRTEELEKANQHLRREIVERGRTEKRLLDYQARLRRMGSELLLSEDRERRKLAVLLHDEISQTLFISLIKLKTMAESPGSPKAVETINELIDHFETMMRELRSLTIELSPPVLYELGVTSALAWACEQVESKYNIRASFRSDGVEIETSEEIKGFIFRAVRELLMNVVKHSHATLAEVFIKMSGSNLIVSVADNGVGLPASPPDNGKQTFGLFSVSERTKALGGEFELSLNSGGGTRATLKIPVANS